MSSIVRVSELGQVTGVTPNSLFLTSYGESNPRQSKFITKQDLLGQYATTGSNTFNGDQTISGSLHISGTTTLGGNIVPLTPRGATLGSLTLPFADIFVSSGSINIAGIPGQPNTTLSNVSGNILISAGGIQLLGTGSFNATTASFAYLSGSFTHVGSQFNIGNTVTTGSLQVSGSSTQIGNNMITGSNSLMGNNNISGSNTIIGNTFMTGSINVTGSQTFIGNQILSGSLNVSGSMDYVGNLHHVGVKQLTGSLNVSGSSTQIGVSTLTGSLQVSGSTTQIGNNTLIGNSSLSGSVGITGSLTVTNIPQGTLTDSALVINPTTHVVSYVPQPLRTNYGLFSQTANSAIISGTTVETSILGTGVGSLIIVANGFNVGDSFKADLGGQFSTANNETITIRVKAANTGMVLADSGPQTVSNVSTNIWTLSLNFIVRQVGVAGVASIATIGRFIYNKTINASSEGFAFTTINNTTFDTTLQTNLVVTIQFGSNSATNTMYSDIFTLNKIY